MRPRWTLRSGNAPRAGSFNHLARGLGNVPALRRAQSRAGGIRRAFRLRLLPLRQFGRGRSAEGAMRLRGRVAQSGRIQLMRPDGSRRPAFLYFALVS
jgi:hypothetical protein